MTSSSGPIRNGIFLIQNVETNTFLKLSSNNRIESRPMRSGTTSPSTRMLWLVDERFDGYVTIRNAARNESYASIQYDIEGFNARIVFSQVPCSWAIAEATFSQYIIRTGNSMSSLSMYWELLDDAPGTVVTLEESQIQGFRWKFYSQRRTPTVAPPALPYSIQNIFNPSRLRTRPPRPEEDDEPPAHPILSKYLGWLGDPKKEPVYGASGSKTDSNLELSSSKGKDKSPIRSSFPMLPEDDTSELEQQAGIIVRIDSTEDLVETPVMNTQAEDDEAEPEPERFNDAADAPDDQSITRITDITIRHCGTVFGIQVSYVLSDGRVFAPSHGNPTITHNEDRVILSEMESIVAVQGTASSGIIWQLAFVIRDLKDHTERVCGPFGDHVNFGVWPGMYRFEVAGRIVAFGGKCTPTMLTGISCITDGAPPVTEVEMEKDAEVESDDNDT